MDDVKLSQEMRSFVANKLAEGFDTADEIVEGAVAGYTFYHAQDTERAPSGLLFLAYGSVKPGRDWKRRRPSTPSPRS